MAPRDRFMPPEYWKKHFAFRESAIRSFEEEAAKRESTSDDQVRLRWAISHYRLELLIANYSGGTDIAILKHLYSPVIDALEAYLEIRGEPFSFKVLDKYVHALWLIALAILLDATDNELARVTRLFDYAGYDGLFERLVALRFPQRPIKHTFADPLLYPRPYEFLYRALDADGPEQDALIAQFLKRYYRGMRHAYWHDRHLSTDTGFFGYWCFELAAFVKVLHIPDQSFADNVYYPRDLVVPSDARHEEWP
jgi:Domain of unknown function (DUF1911)/Domain of unknown function (DUF1910)